MDNTTLFLNLLVAVLGGAVRVGTPFLMVSLAECITEKSGRINLGLEGVLVFSAMAGFGGAYLSGSVWLGVLAAVAEIHQRQMDVRNRSGAVLLISEDLDELLALSDRIAVMSGGRVVHEVAALEADRNTLGAYMGGRAH